MRISITSPFPADSLQGNSVSGRRITGLLKSLGHHARLFHNGFAPDCELLIALNAWRSSAVIAEFAEIRRGIIDHSTGFNASFNRVQSPTKEGTVPKIAVVMTGSDLFPFDGLLKPETLQSINFADAVIITHGEARERIHHPMVRVIRKSIALPEEFLSQGKPRNAESPAVNGIMVAHLREQKNPFLFLRAVPHLKSPIHIDHFGHANSAEFQENAEKYHSHAYHWKGEVARTELLRALQKADFLLNTSYIEGSSNAVCESIALGTPVIASAIPGNIGVLGADYPGLFGVDDTKGLAEMLDRFANSKGFRLELVTCCSQLAGGLAESRESQDWAELIEDLAHS